MRTRLIALTALFAGTLLIFLTWRGLPRSERERAPEPTPSDQFPPMEAPGPVPATPTPAPAPESPNPERAGTAFFDEGTTPVIRDAAWAKQRRSRMAALIREDPEAALAEALTPRQYAALPASVRAMVERPVATEGFYGVYAVCDHAAGESHGVDCEIRREVVLGMGTFDAEALRAHVYGRRQDQATEENESLYGVVMDGEIALHEDEAVLVDEGPDVEGGRYAVYHRDTANYFEDLAEAEAFRDQVHP